MTCSRCGETNREGNRFCAHCGASLEAACGSCDAPLEIGARFCGQCGTPVADAGADLRLSGRHGEVAPPTAERRHVSVLFVDLVGFTTLSESRDPEVVRDLLSDYFDHARTVVGRYGGTIEKFIGDAVMAVWGTPVAREDDAERAVRAGLDLVDAVSALGEQRALPGLQARAGVVTGEAAVRLDAIDQSMVAGDVVNTASRVQSVAAPGQVLVDDVTREASSRAIEYAAAREHTLKGRSEPLQLFAARQVVAGSGGAQRFDGLEPPFVGRERDLRMLKELLHDTVEHSRARLVVVTGGAGVGKSRLGWELFKYVDGIEQLHYWHTGRCLSYGEGIAYWSLAEMVRMRFRIGEGDSDADVVRKLDDGLVEYVRDAEERAWLRPRLAILLGTSDAPAEAIDRHSLFAGWRLLFERLATQAPVVLVFEDMQDADDGLLDFIDHLVQYAAELPLFLLVLARPELHDQRPAWGHQRSVTLLHLDRLSDERVEDMVAAMVDGISDSARGVLAAQAEGVPLFAIETVRMLIDRDIVVPREGRYVLAADVGELDDLDVPPTLQSLVAARLDDLPELARRLVGDASVLGQSFTRDALEAIVAAAGDVPVDAIDRLLHDLTVREVLTLRADARSPEAGQHRFVQKLMQTVAYQRLSRDDRKVRHLAAAEHLQRTHDAADSASLIAAHLLGAAEARPEDPDAPELRQTATHHLERAGDRARSLAAIEEAMRYYERALELCEDDADRARLSEAAGVTAQLAAKFGRALDHLIRARELLDRRGDPSGVARVASWQAETLLDLGRPQEALSVAKAAWTDPDEPEAGDARLAAAIAMLTFNLVDGDSPRPWLERAASAAEGAGAWEVLGRALSLKGAMLSREGRPVEAEAITSGAYELAKRHGLHFRAAIQALYLSSFSIDRDLDEAQAWADASTAAARRSGDRFTLAASQECQATVCFERGDWDRLDIAGLRAAWVSAAQDNAVDHLPTYLVLFAVHLGNRSLLVDGDPLAGMDNSAAETRGSALVRQALLAAADGHHEEALEAATEARRHLEEHVSVMPMRIATAVAMDAALGLGRLDAARELVGARRSKPPVTPVAAAHRTWAQARLAAAEGQHAVAQDGFRAAARTFRDWRRPFWLGRVLLDHAEWMAGRGETEQAAVLGAEAHAIFAGLGAVVLAEQAARVRGLEAPA